MEISFNVTSLARDADGKSKVTVTATAVDGSQVFTGQTIYAMYLGVPFAEDHFSVESYIVKVLFNLSVALQDEGDSKGQTTIAKLMLDSVEHQ